MKLKYSDLQEFRKLYFLIDYNKFKEIYKKAVPHVDDVYIENQWKPFSDYPVMYLTWHSHGESIFNEMIKAIE